MSTIRVPILAIALLLLVASPCFGKDSGLVLVSTSMSMSTSSSSSSGSAADPMDDNLAVEGRNVKIVRRIRVRTSTTPAPPPQASGEGAQGEFRENPDINEWFALKHQEFERVKSPSTATVSSVGNPSNSGSGSAPVPRSKERLLKEAEYVYEFSDTSNGPRVQVIYGDGKTPPPAGLMESQDMLNLVHEHLHDTKTNEVHQAPLPSPSPPPSASPAAVPVPVAQPGSPYDGLLPPIYHVGGGPLSSSPGPGPSSGPPPSFFSSFPGPPTFTSGPPVTETKTYVSSGPMPTVFAQPTSVTMPPMQGPGMRVTSAWKWPTYIEEQQSNGAGGGFDYSFPPPEYTSGGSGPPPPNYYPFHSHSPSPYEEPVYIPKPPAAQGKNRPEPGSINSIPWTPLPPTPAYASAASAYQQKEKLTASGSGPQSSRIEPGSYSTLGKRMTAPDTRSPDSMGRYPDEYPHGYVPDSVVKESHYVDSYSSPMGMPMPNSEYYDSSAGAGGGGSGDDEYSQYVMSSSPPSSYSHSYEMPSFSPMPVPVPSYSMPEMFSHGPPPPPQAAYSQGPPPPPSMYSPGPSSLPSYFATGYPPPPVQKHYKIVLVRPPAPAPAPAPEESNLVAPEVEKKTLVYILHQGPKAGPAIKLPPPPPATDPSPPQVYYVKYSDKYKKRST